MFALPGIWALVLFIYARPHEIYRIFVGIPAMYLLYGLCALGVAVDVRLRLTTLRFTPQSVLAALFVAWTAVATGIGAPDAAGPQLVATVPPLIVYFVVAQGAPTLRGLEQAAAAFLVVLLVLAAVGLDQSRSGFQCVRLGANASSTEAVGYPDGRPCHPEFNCHTDGQPGQDYICEKPGPVGTTSIGSGRVRYRGVLQDPNEFALALGMSLPLALAFFDRRRSLLRLALLLATAALVLFVVVQTRSRTGQLVLLAAAGLYFISAVGWKGMVTAALLAAPVLLFGGRGGEEASASAAERPEAWRAGFQMWLSSPLFGVGRRQFLEHHYITAHNTFVLELAELGLVGLFVWIALWWVSFKMVHAGLTRLRHRPEAAAAVIWGRALLALLGGALAGCGFLSLSTHPVVWTVFGLTGAYYLAIRHHDPGFRVDFGRRDAAAVVTLTVLFPALLQGYLRLTGH
jgi:hypothetical protein